MVTPTQRLSRLWTLPAARGISLLAVTLLTLLALVLRTWRLGSIPAGLHFDEASHGLLVENHILRGETPVFFSAYTGHEALFHYTVAPFLIGLGPSILALRLPAALWSSALVPLVYLLGVRLWGQHQGIAAALATACGGWLVHVGRIAFRANTLPVVSALAIWWLYRALTDTTPHLRRRAAILSGACFGLSLYTYLAVRMLPLLGPMLLIYLAIWHRPLLRRSRRDIPWFMLASIVVSMPLIVHMIRIPGDFLERVNQIGISASNVQGSRLHQAGYQTLLTLLMFGFRGARDGFFNLPYRPVFPGITVIPFYLGVLLALRHWRSLAHALMLIWLSIMLLPTILAADAPHWLRAIGAAPPTYLLWGLGAGWIWDQFSQRWYKGAAIGWLIIVLSAGWWTQATAREYFDVWARRPELYYEYMQFATDAARDAATTPSDQTLLISEAYYRHATYLYLAPRTRTAQWFDARYAVVWPRTAPWTSIVSISTPATSDMQPLLVHAHGESYAPNGQYAYVKIQGTDIPPFTPPIPLETHFGNLLDLRGVGFTGAPQPGAQLHVQLYCQATAAHRQELRIFVHLEDESGKIVAQQDALGYDAREWQPGDRFISFHNLALPDTLPSGKLRLVAGLYDVATGSRYSVTGTGAMGDFIELPLP